MSGHVSIRIGVWSLTAASVILLAISVAVGAAMPSGIELLGIGASVGLIWNASLFALVGAIITLRKSGHLVGWLFVIAGLGWSAYAMASSYAEYSLAFPERTLPVEDLVIWTSSWTPLLAIGCVPALLLFVFPTGHLSSSRWRWPARAGVLAAAAGVIGSAFAAGPYQDFPEISNPYPAPDALEGLMFVFKEMAWPILIVVFLFGARNLRERARMGDAKERAQVKWMVLSALGMAAFAAFWGATYLLGSQDLAQSISGVVVSVLPISVGIAMMKHHLYDIDLILNRTLVYGALTGILSLVYLGVVVLMQRLLAPVTADSDLAVATSTLAVAGLFSPLRSRVQSFIDRRYYRRRYDAAEILQHFGGRLRDQVDLDALTDELVSAAGATFQPAHASVWLRDGSGEQR